MFTFWWFWTGLAPGPAGKFTGDTGRCKTGADLEILKITGAPAGHRPGFSPVWNQIILNFIVFHRVFTGMKSKFLKHHAIDVMFVTKYIKICVWIVTNSRKKISRQRNLCENAYFNVLIYWYWTHEVATYLATFKNPVKPGRIKKTGKTRWTRPVIHRYKIEISWVSPVSHRYEIGYFYHRYKPVYRCTGIPAGPGANPD